MDFNRSPVHHPLQRTWHPLWSLISYRWPGVPKLSPRLDRSASLISEDKGPNPYRRWIGIVYVIHNPSVFLCPQPNHQQSINPHVLWRNVKGFCELVFQEFKFTKGCGFFLLTWRAVLLFANVWRSLCRAMCSRKKFHEFFTEAEFFAETRCFNSWEFCPAWTNGWDFVSMY